MKFQNASQVQLVNGGYLSDVEGLPIFNDAFVKAQRRAEEIVFFSEEAKGKDFKGKTPDSLSDVKKAVLDRIKGSAPVFFEVPTAPENKLQDQLKAEALSFVNFQEKKDDTDRLNAFMQEFVVLKDFEDHGLFFEEGIVKLNKIYTLDDVKEALKNTINYL